ncbi:cation:proton antiporter [Streptomyces sp. NPDC088817]|uniref:cation:proton antiporter n=1 Tax=unclassified Streptomyces TaxID=2593676 RepID=UPI0036EB14BB
MELALHALAVLAVVLVVARPARRAATLVRQPPVIGEIALGLIVVPVLTTAAGPGLVGTVLPAEVTDHVHTVGLAGLALYLTGVGHSARPRRSEVSPRSYGWLLAGSLLPGLLAGMLVSGWVVWRDEPGDRGTAPTAALVLLLAAAFAVTAVPVLARILTDRGIADTTEGRLSLLVAVTIDALTWLVLTAALAAAASGSGRFVRAAAVIIAGAMAALTLRWLLGRTAVGRLCARWPVAAAIALCAIAVAAAMTTERAGLTAIFGAVLVGLAVPQDGEWGPRTRTVRTVQRCGLLFVPVFFVTAGLQMSADGADGFSWATLVLVLLLATAAKLGGGYAGARAARLPTGTALRFGVLMNTRGLTEIAVLQAGLSAGILSSGLFLALALMAVVTTAATGPLLSAVDHRYPSTGHGTSTETDFPPHPASEELSHDEA